jgi:hypothetical protein
MRGPRPKRRGVSFPDMRVGDEVDVTCELGKERHHAVEIRVSRFGAAKGEE